MSKKPWLNALVAMGYIVVLVSAMNFGTRIVPRPNQYLAPIAVISLFTLSAAVMAYVFGYQPLMLFLEGKKKTAVNLFLKTTVIFGLITILTLILVFSGLVK